jgi:hypothetical protein
LQEVCCDAQERPLRCDDGAVYCKPEKTNEGGKAGQAGMQPQPKVVDQQIAQMAAPPPQQMAAAPQQQMLPEDTGIGQLPAQNMQTWLKAASLRLKMVAACRDMLAPQDHLLILWQIT